MRKPKFIYFDLGKVLVDFDVEVMCRQIAEVVGTDSPAVRNILFGGDLQRQCELGQRTGAEFHEIFCQQAGRQIDAALLEQAASAIFELNLSIIPVVAQLRQAGHRLGILSNTSQAHWEYCRGRFPILKEAFEVYTLSYRVGAMKPDAAIYLAAAELAGVSPRDIFYTDDIAGHIAGGQIAGFDAVQYTSTPQLVQELRCRGVEFNY
jgi:glucose-1-phosphatase